MIIAFTGKIKSGKSTACDLLVKRGYQVINFADPLKKMAADLLEIPLAECYDQEAKERLRNFTVSVDEFCMLLASEGLNPTPFILKQDLYKFKNLREVLQFIGTQLFRESNPNFWVNKLLASVDPNKDYVVGDCRFLNEVQAIQNAGGAVVRIERPAIKSNDTHQSEQIVDRDLVDYNIINIEFNQFKSDVMMIEELIRHGKRSQR